MAEQTYETIVTETTGMIGIVRLNRPEALNALSAQLIGEMTTALEAFDADEAIRVLILTGNARAFAAGADIKQMTDDAPGSAVRRLGLGHWDRLRKLRKPVIAAVSGYCLGGGCELAMTCDMIIAADNARFGQPEINLGIIPGGGGTQRLVRAIGKARAMELILTGRMMSAREAYEAGLVTKVVPAEAYMAEALELATVIASKAPIAAQLCKDAVLKAFDASLEVGLDYERRNFAVAFGTEDRLEGTRAFVEKRQAEFKGR